MRIYDDIFSWNGFGGIFQLASGQCRLQIFDLRKGSGSKVAPMKPFIVVVSDLVDTDPDPKKMSVRSCAGHIATQVAEQFQIDPQRMVYVEFAQESIYGAQGQHRIPAKYESVDFSWHGGKALHPRWRPLETHLKETLVELMDLPKVH